MRVQTLSSFLSNNTSIYYYLPMIVDIFRYTTKQFIFINKLYILIRYIYSMIHSIVDFDRSSSLDDAKAARGEHVLCLHPEFVFCRLRRWIHAPLVGGATDFGARRRLHSHRATLQPSHLPHWDGMSGHGASFCRAFSAIYNHFRTVDFKNRS